MVVSTWFTGSWRWSPTAGGGATIAAIAPVSWPWPLSRSSRGVAGFALAYGELNAFLLKGAGGTRDAARALPGAVLLAGAVAGLASVVSRL